MNANETSIRRLPSSAPSKHSAMIGVLIVVVAVAVTVLMFAVGGGEGGLPGGASTAAGSDAAGSDAAGRAGVQAGAQSGAQSGGQPSAPTSTLVSAVSAVTVPPGELEVVVANGSSVAGRAKVTSEKLAAIGYTNVRYVEGKTSSNTIVFFAAGHDGDGAVLTRLLGLSEDRSQPIVGQTPTKEPAPSAALTVLVGADFDPAIAPFATTIPPQN